jgi:hypothetical protein
MAKTDLKQFDYMAIAQADTKAWKAYYNHAFHKMFWYLLIAMKTQLGFNWFRTLRLAYYSAWAAADYRINRKNVNIQRVLKNITKYYKLISDHVTEPFDYKEAARLEVEWWEIHRRSYKNNAQLEKALAENLAIVHNVDPAVLKDYAHYRAEAMILPRHVGDDQNPTDWDEVYRLVEKAWKSLHEAVNKTSK